MSALGRADVRERSDREEREGRDGKPDERQADDAQIGGGHPDRRERARPHHDDSETRGQHLERLHGRQPAVPRPLRSIEDYGGES
jgi:hypothetical protein